MHTLTTRVRLELPPLASVRKRVVPAGKSVGMSDADAAKVSGLFGMRQLLRRGDVTIVRGKPDDTVMRVVRLDGQELPAPVASLDRVETVVRTVQHVEELIGSLTDEERERAEKRIGELQRERWEEQERAEGHEPADLGEASHTAAGDASLVDDETYARNARALTESGCTCAEYAAITGALNPDCPQHGDEASRLEPRRVDASSDVVRDASAGAGERVEAPRVEGEPSRSADERVETPPLATLEGMSIPKAAPRIEATDDIELLQRWRDADGRQGVHRLIDARLEELTAPPKPGG